MSIAEAYDFPVTHTPLVPPHAAARARQHVALGRIAGDEQEPDRDLGPARL